MLCFTTATIDLYVLIMATIYKKIDTNHKSLWNVPTILATIVNVYIGHNNLYEFFYIGHSIFQSYVYQCSH